MKINTNRWNQWRYAFYAPFYDNVASLFKKARERSISLLEVGEQDKVLIIGAGTGLDLPFLPEQCDITATDLTPAMLSKIPDNMKSSHPKLKIMAMDGQRLAFENNSFDKVILHLILAVIPDPVACLKEAERVCKPGGSIAIFDKFIPEGKSSGFFRKFLNVFTNILATNINRDFSVILEQTQLSKKHQENAGFRENFRIVLLEK